MNPQSASKTWRGRCMWAFEDGDTGRAWMSERSVRVKFQALLLKKDGSYSHSRQHSIGYPIPTLHSPDPSNWPSLKVACIPFLPFFSCSASYFFFSLSPTNLSVFPPLLYFGRGIYVTAFGLVVRWSPFKWQGILNKAGLCISCLDASGIGRMVRLRIRYAFDSYIVFLLFVLQQWIFVVRRLSMCRSRCILYCCLLSLYLRKCLLFICLSQCQCLCFIYVYLFVLSRLSPLFVAKRPSDPVEFQQGWKIGWKPQTIRQQRVVQDPDWVCKQEQENFNSLPARLTRSMPILCLRHDW